MAVRGQSALDVPTINLHRQLRPGRRPELRLTKRMNVTGGRMITDVDSYQAKISTAAGHRRGEGVGVDRHDKGCEEVRIFQGSYNYSLSLYCARPKIRRSREVFLKGKESSAARISEKGIREI